jgi:hypothetical protein
MSASACGESCEKRKHNDVFCINRQRPRVCRRESLGRARPSLGLAMGAPGQPRPIGVARAQPWSRIEAID